ncbi:MAG: endo alpha-1,4 polygalactosaminidase [Alphaproteobacteria bacterium]|nr:endo alpha-1,4 polygalactosaminidase [Alphaproteobacteria bacterium]MCB9699456.1 endo alpha-1,4 polygalactosaminidase [Alphaproteobacteria bacterium]
MTAWMVAAALVACTESDTCDEGRIRDGKGGCERYVAGDPVPSEAIPVRNGVTWQWQITGKPKIAYDVEVYDLDLYDTSDEDVAQVHDEGRVLICYFSAGSFEPWRDDADLFPEEAIGKPLDGWPDERWLDHTNPVVRELMLDRLDEAAAHGCDGVEPDNVTASHNRSGFGLNDTEQLDYNRFLADAAHERGMGVALKNDVEQVHELLPWFDYTVNEECAAYDECHRLAPFVDEDKAVLHTEYVDHWEDAADKAAEVCGVEPGLSTIIKTWDLGGERLACDE